MPESEGSSTRPPQISAMFQKFALSFKAKAFEFFAEDDQSTAVTATAASEKSETISLLESPEEFISDQKVVVIKPAPPPEVAAQPLSPPKPTNREGRNDAQFNQTLISSLLATISSFEASYLELQTAHVPFDEESIRTADKALVSHLQTLSEFKQLHKNYYSNPNFHIEFSTASCLEFQANENQSKLRALKSVFNRLQSEIDGKDEQVSVLRRKLDDIEKLNAKLSDSLGFSCLDQNYEVLLTVKVFDSMLRDSCRLVYKFTKMMIDLMKKKSQFDFDFAANSVYSDVSYAKKEDIRYAILSYVFLRMFQGFDSESFGLTDDESLCNEHLSNDTEKNNHTYYLKQLVDHVSCNNPIESLRKSPRSEFSSFCEARYQDLIHPTIFFDVSQKEAVLSLWKDSLGVLYEVFVKMVSSVWSLHKLAYSFDPPVEIFQVERGVDFSMVYMEDVTRRYKFDDGGGKARPKVGFTVVPGYKIGKTVIQSQVYLTGTGYGARTLRDESC